ncbi:aminopeptidase N [Methylocaldum szegediense]|uniref:Aminopeptidase N n=1 Tax=Methylocaldum szegediense TaxID=73780 RepID=A0ABN8X2F1_9GAMM|nr:aminopeptidase N [Methylocaldum szegediense]CAI8781906.1 aminopeptidase N [Methylocaldum szegediense]
MREHTPKTIYLKDYTPPDYLIDTVDLFFELDEENTRVTAKLRVRRNPESPRENPELELNGEELLLESIKLNGRGLNASEYRLSEESLVLPSVPDRPFDLEIVTRINPKANTALEGLYLSKDMLCTQCEAQGFRKITYFIDRPDVMAKYTTTLVADKSRYPVLLSNGNRIASGELKNGRHWVKWEDPFKKPSYLFALVAGRLECVEDRYVTRSGKEVTLQIFVEKHDLDKCDHAMQSLKNAMRWDEENYGREYDLNLYMIVAISHFNMGAMENKGLNVFNTKCVLARPDTATDSDYEHIEGVIGHEYFHNWTGNRITCRDWFQLSLKEGLTVFRDQEFSADRTSRAVKRIDEVNMLRTKQFAEDAGPLAHPVRPESYIEINNFYTLTVYEKGAEVVRMMQTLLGKDGFRRGTDLYFQRHDGQAVTCDDFVKCMEDANGVDLTQFRRWYSQAGTPEVHIAADYDAANRVLNLTVRQSCPPTPGQPVKAPFHIPLAIGLLAPDGTELPLQLEGETEPHGQTTRVLDLKEPDQQFRFVGLPEKPVVSALRGFSAPVRLHMNRSDQELAFLFSHDPDPFNRWDAGQQLATQVILDLAGRLSKGETPTRVDSRLIEAYRRIIGQDWADLSYFALLLTLPSEEYISASMAIVDPDAVHQARQTVKRELAATLEQDFRRLYQTHHVDEAGRFDAEAVGRRRLKNVCLSYLSELETEDVYRLSVRQFREARTMTDQIAALSTIVNSHNPEKSDCLAEFYERWRDDDLVIDKWFALQATCHLPGTLDRVRELLSHPAFDLKVPNRVRSLIGAFSQSNPVNFHARDGAGYALLADHVITLNALNPQVAARMLTALTPWRRYDKHRQRLMREQLQRIAGVENVSKDVYEVAMKSLS